MPDRAAAEAFIDTYRRTFESFDVAAITALYAFPVQVVGDAGEIRQQLAHPRARLTMLLEGVRRPEELGMPTQEAEALAFEEGKRGGLPVELLQGRLVIIQIELRGRPDEMDEDHALRLGGEVRAHRRSGQQSAEGRGAQAEAQAAKEGPSMKLGTHGRSGASAAVDGFIKIQDHRGDIDEPVGLLAGGLDRRLEYFP